MPIFSSFSESTKRNMPSGSDYSGVVDSVGPNVSNFKVGYPVCLVASLGSFTYFIIANQSDLFRVPEGCDLIVAGALPVAFGTSHVTLVHRARLVFGQVLLVIGAAGGVGLAAVQIGTALGAVVITIVMWRSRKW